MRTFKTELWRAQLNIVREGLWQQEFISGGERAPALERSSAVGQRASSDGRAELLPTHAGVTAQQAREARTRQD